MSQSGIELVADIAESALRKPKLASDLYGLAKTQIEGMIAHAHLSCSDRLATKVERILEPALRAMAYLPEHERGGCYKCINQYFKADAPSEFQLVKKVNKYATEVTTGGARISDSLIVSDLAELLKKEITPRERILGPWLVEESICLLHAWRGTGKSLFTLGAAIAIASGTEFLGWKAEQPRSVLYVDGEMPESLIQQRTAQLVSGNEQLIEPNMLRFVYLDNQPSGQLPNLSTLDGQQRLNSIIKDYEVIILDNISCLAPLKRENDADSWHIMDAWLLSLRTMGKSIILVHHSNKSGGQRGSSAKEGIVDSVIKLVKPPNMSESDGAVFEVHFEKSRHFYGKDADSFLARYNPDDDLPWSREEIDYASSDTRTAVAELKALGLSKSEIARQLGIHPSTVGRNW